MKREYRLRKGEDFKKVIDNNLATRTPSYQIYLKPNDIGHLRVGISTSKRLGNAVTRVGVRRKIRAFFTVYKMYEKKYDIVIVAKPGFLDRPSSENKDELSTKINSLIAKGENKK